MPYKNYVLLRFYEFVYITKGKYLSQVSFPSFEDAKKYIDVHEYVELFPPEFNIFKVFLNTILYTFYIHSAYYLFHSKYYIYASAFHKELGNERIRLLIGIELVRIVCISIKYIYIYFSKKYKKISYAENCTKKDLIFILINKNFDLLLLLTAFLIMLFTSNVIFGLLPFVLFFRTVVRWQRSLNYKKR